MHNDHGKDRLTTKNTKHTKKSESMGPAVATSIGWNPGAKRRPPSFLGYFFVIFVVKNFFDIIISAERKPNATSCVIRTIIAPLPSPH